jgi:hypothetical protein
MHIYDKNDLGKCFHVIEAWSWKGCIIAKEWFFLHIRIVKKTSVGCFRHSPIGWSLHGFGAQLMYGVHTMYGD